MQDALRDALKEVRGSYDAILCDTPPSLETLAWLPAVAADVALTPTPAEALAVQELTHAARFLERVRWARNPRLVWLGVALTMFSPKLAIHATYARVLRETYGDLVLSNPVPYNVAFKECVVARKPLVALEAEDGRREGNRRPGRRDRRSGQRPARQRPGPLPGGRGMSKKSEALMKNFGGTIASTVGRRPQVTPEGAGGNNTDTRQVCRRDPQPGLRRDARLGDHLR